MRSALTPNDDDALAHRRSAPGTRLRAEDHELLRAGLAASPPQAADDEVYELPKFDPGRVLVEDQRAIKDMLDDEDVERATRRAR